MEVRCGIIRFISSGTLDPTNKVSSVNGIAELARSRAILDFTFDPVFFGKYHFANFLVLVRRREFSNFCDKKKTPGKKTAVCRFS